MIPLAELIGAATQGFSAYQTGKRQGQEAVAEATAEASKAAADKARNEQLMALRALQQTQTQQKIDNYEAPSVARDWRDDDREDRQESSRQLAEARVSASQEAAALRAEQQMALAQMREGMIRSRPQIESSGGDGASDSERRQRAKQEIAGYVATLPPGTSADGNVINEIRKRNRVPFGYAKGLTEELFSKKWKEEQKASGGDSPSGMEERRRRREARKNK